MLEKIYIVFIALAVSLGLGEGVFNIPGSCPLNLYGCLQCLSRGSDDLERCQQLFFYVTYTNMSNEDEILSYCSGDCPILLATAQYYCSQTSSISSLFKVCPGYNVVPTGAFNVDANYSRQHCLERNTNTRCSQCIGENTREAIQCLQTYLLAQYSNNTATYVQQYCSSNCPVTMWSTSWYCNLQSDRRRAYDICEKHGATYCLELEQQSPTDFTAAVIDCQSSCDSNPCIAARTKYGCCIRRRTSVCADIPECPKDAAGGTQRLNFNSQCPFNQGCLQCLSRNSDALERCEQLYSIIMNIESHESEEQEFCTGQCPTLLIFSRYFCRIFDSDTLMGIMNICPSYNVMPTTSIDIRANYSGQNCFSSFSSSGCSECILSQSSELTRCFQLYILSQYANMSQIYMKAFCTSSCAARMATLQWYCSGLSAQQIYSNCVRRDENTYCAPLLRHNINDVRSMGSACSSNCTSELCNLGKEEFGCCLRPYISNNSACPEIPTCSLVTLAGAPPLLAATIVTLMAAILSLVVLI